MDEIIKKIREQNQKLGYLDGTRERNLQIVNKRIREINEEKEKANKRSDAKIER